MNDPNSFIDTVAELFRSRSEKAAIAPTRSYSLRLLSWSLRWRENPSWKTPIVMPTRKKEPMQSTMLYASVKKTSEEKSARFGSTGSRVVARSAPNIGRYMTSA